MRKRTDAGPFNLTTIGAGASSYLRRLVERAALGRNGGDALRFPDGDEPSGSPLVLVDESAQDVATRNGAAGRRDEARDRLGQLQATVWSRFVVVADVLQEHRLKMSP
jgi:hypothetical protein